MALHKDLAPTAKKAKLYNSRTIRTESVEPSLRNGVLNASEFIASREFEIRAFEQSQLNTKSASSSRIFQSLPRTLRRRTASHNVKRIPKRLRARALREMRSSGLSESTKKRPTGRELHKMRMTKKLLHMASKLRELKAPPQPADGSLRERYHILNKQLNAAKRRLNAPLNNASGAHDRVGIGMLCQIPLGGVKFGNRQRKFVWTPNHIWHAKRFHMMKKWGYQFPFSPNQKCFRATSRASKTAALAFETSYYCSLVVQCPDAAGVLSALQAFTTYYKTVPQWLLLGQKAYNGWLYIENERAALVSAYVNSESNSIFMRLHPADFTRCFDAVCLWASKQKETVVSDCRFALGSIELRGPKALNCLSQILHIKDQTECHDAWRVCSHSSDPNLIPVGTAFAFFTKDPRQWKHPIRAPPAKGNIVQLLAGDYQGVDPEAAKALLSLELRAESYKDMLTVKLIENERSRRDPSSPSIHASSNFPILIYKLQTGAWCVTMPWFWVQPVWSMLTKVKDLKAAAYRQMHQLNLESLQASYPYDYPYLPAGYQDHQFNTKAIESAREKLPTSKRAPYEKTEGTLLPGCDWFYLQKWTYGQMLLKQKGPEETHLFGEFDAEHNRILRNSEDLAFIISSIRSKAKNIIPVTSLDMSDPVHKAIVEGTFKPDVSKFPRLPLVQISLKLVKTGNIKDNARVYLGKEGNLVGFVTSASFNLTAGAPMAIALISAHCKEFKMVHIRNVGCTSFYPAHFQILE